MMGASARTFRIVAVALAVAAAPAARAATLAAVEYYNATLDHYFVTSFADEIAKLDAGAYAGWQRTGQHFAAIDPATPVAGASPVCRFYGDPAAGLDSHFYSASPAECDALLLSPPGAWLEETADAFGVWLPDPLTGQCPATSIPIYRAWNNRIDSNHRFTTDPATQQAMIARGYIAEGYGPPPMPVAMCAPPEDAPGPGAVPACVVTASERAPYVGSAVTLSATCSNGAATFVWTGCASSASDCTVTSSSIGGAFYSVIARNAAGASAPASITITWQVLPPPPKCAIARTSQTDPPVVNDAVVLEAHCDATVGSYAWTGCTGTGSVCTVRETTAGTRTYRVIGSNAGGSSSPASLTLDWSASAPSPPGLCAQFPSYLFSDIGASGARVESASFPVPPGAGFAWNGAWAVRFVVPSTMDPTRLGKFVAAESAGPATVREATLSRVPCDFRPTDPAGVNGPFSRASGIMTTNRFTIDPAQTGYPVLTPGSAYYLNLRNWQAADNTISCPAPGRCDAYVDGVLPR